MKKFLLSLLACGICDSAFTQIIDPQLEIWAKASVIAPDQAKNIVYARKIEGAIMFRFFVKKEYINKFHAGEAISIQFNNKKVSIPEKKGTQEVRIGISDIEIPTIRANDFYLQLLVMQKADKFTEFKNKTQPSMRKMLTEVYRKSKLVKACCDEGTKNGIEFILPADWTEENLKREVYIYNDLVLTDQINTEPPLLVFPISGYWVDSARQIDTPHYPTKWIDFGDNIKMRPNTGESEKWVITPVSTMKGVLGRLDINYPAGVDRWILYYQPADNKYMGSVGSNEKTFNISPGEYRFLITDVPVDNVPIQKGHETRIKMGFLNVVSEGGFYLYNDTKEKLYTTYDKPKKIALPVGNYQVKLGGQFYPFVIKDGETVEY